MREDFNRVIRRSMGIISRGATMIGELGGRVNLSQAGSGHRRCHHVRCQRCALGVQAGNSFRQRTGLSLCPWGLFTFHGTRLLVGMPRYMCNFDRSGMDPIYRFQDIPGESQVRVSKIVRSENTVLVIRNTLWSVTYAYGYDRSRM
jgi:hypothetical protein